MHFFCSRQVFFVCVYLALDVLKVSLYTMLALSLETCLSHSDKVCTHEKDMWTGEIAQQLRALVSLPENLGSIPSTQMVANNCVYLQSKWI